MFEPVKGCWSADGKHLVIKVVKQPDETPLVIVCVRFTVAFSTRPHSRLDREAMLAQTIALRVLAEQFPRFFRVGVVMKFA